MRALKVLAIIFAPLASAAPQTRFVQLLFLTVRKSTISRRRTVKAWLMIILTYLFSQDWFRSHLCCVSISLHQCLQGRERCEDGKPDRGKGFLPGVHLAGHHRIEPQPQPWTFELHQGGGGVRQERRGHDLLLQESRCGGGQQELELCLWCGDTCIHWRPDR